MSEEQIVLEQLLQRATDSDVVLATILATRGSVPRHVGSKMIIDPQSGEMIGTIGGGCGEADVIAAARDVASSGQPQLIHVQLMDSIDSFSPAVCGGTMDIFIERVSARL
ncbi:MAG TPA: XdhC family protein [Longimicrobiales bacterium]